VGLSVIEKKFFDHIIQSPKRIFMSRNARGSGWKYPGRLNGCALDVPSRRRFCLVGFGLLVAVTNHQAKASSGWKIFPVPDFLYALLSWAKSKRCNNACPKILLASLGRFFSRPHFPPCTCIATSALFRLEKISNR
jgi:hypothetical protein